jgi:3-methyladenine DNA glycosylase AlkD
MAVSKVALVKAFGQRFRREGTAERAEGMKAYMKSELSFFGVDQGTIRTAARELSSEHAEEPLSALLPALEALAASDWFELRSAAIGVLERRRKELEPAHLDMLIRWVERMACWAHVDWIATKLVGPVIARNPQEKARLLRWAKAPSFWVRRTAILAQLEALSRGGGDFELFTRIAVPLLGEKEFFIRKAIGWVLRAVSRKRPELVRAFLAEHGEVMSGLTRREASKYV